jgi:O-antigen/teichoic acid export membrane protein
VDRVPPAHTGYRTALPLSGASAVAGEYAGPKSARFFKQATYSFADQAFVSLGTFLTNIFLARHLSATEYGLFVLLFALAMAGQLLNYSLAGYPLGLRLADAKPDASARLSTSSIVFVGTLGIPLAAIVALILAGLDHLDLILPGVIWFSLVQIQQATRRALLAALAHKKAIAGDIVAYIGQVFVVVLIANTGKISLINSLYGIAVFLGLGALLQAVQLKLFINGLQSPRRWLSDNGVLGGWSLAAGALSTFRGYGIFWIVAVFSGTAAVASLQAAMNVFFFLNPLFFSLTNLIPQIAARALSAGDPAMAWRAVRPYVLMILPPVVLYLAFVTTFSQLMLWAFYGPQSPYLAVGTLFPFLAFSTGSLILCELIICYFVGIGAVRTALKINLIGFGIITFAIVPFMKIVGVLEGVCLTLAVGDAIRLALALRCLRKVIIDKSQRGRRYP